MNASKKFTFILIVCGIVGALLGKWAISGLLPSKQEKQHKVLAHAASNINATLPMNIDSETRLFSTAGGQSKFSYHYELVNVLKANFNPDAFEQVMRPNITNAVCTSEEMAAFRDMEITVTYRYFDAQRVEVSKIDVDTTSC